VTKALRIISTFDPYPTAVVTFSLKKTVRNLLENRNPVLVTFRVQPRRLKQPAD
jgi:hypothetical protein